MKISILTAVILLIAVQNSISQWVAIPPPPGVTYNSVFSNNEYLFCEFYYSATSPRILQRSSNSGLTWENANNGITAFRANPYPSVVFLNNLIFYATQNGLFKSSNNGSLWTLSYNNSTYKIIKSVGVFAINKLSILLQDSLFNSKLLISSDLGQTWQEKIMPVNSKYMMTTTAGIGIVSKTNPSNFYYSSNEGNSWTNYSLSDSLEVYSVASYNANLILAGLNNFGKIRIVKSSNNGSNWQNISFNLADSILGGARWISVFQNHILLSTDKAFYVSDLDNIYWYNRNNNLGNYTYYGSTTLFQNSVFLVTANPNMFKRSLSDIIGISNISNQVPDKYFLLQNYPNPFNPQTSIEFSLPEKSFVSLKVFDISGKQIEALVNDSFDAGKYKYDFNAESLPSGTYFYKLETEKFSEVKKMILLK